MSTEISGADLQIAEVQAVFEVMYEAVAETFEPSVAIDEDPGQWLAEMIQTYFAQAHQAAPAPTPPAPVAPPTPRPADRTSYLRILGGYA